MELPNELHVFIWASGFIDARREPFALLYYDSRMKSTRYVLDLDWVQCSDRLPEVDDGNVWICYNNESKTVHSIPVPWFYVQRVHETIYAWKPCNVPKAPENRDELA